MSCVNLKEHAPTVSGAVSCLAFQHVVGTPLGRAHCRALAMGAGASTTSVPLASSIKVRTHCTYVLFYNLPLTCWYVLPQTPHFPTTVLVHGKRLRPHIEGNFVQHKRQAESIEGGRVEEGKERERGCSD